MHILKLTKVKLLASHALVSPPPDTQLRNSQRKKKKIHSTTSKCCKMRNWVTEITLTHYNNNDVWGLIFVECLRMMFISWSLLNPGPWFWGRELPPLHVSYWTSWTQGLLAGFSNIGFLIEAAPLCCHIRGTRKARARQTMAADGFPALMNYAEVIQTWGPSRVVRGEIKEWEVSREHF